MVTDALAPSVTKASAAMGLTMLNQNKPVSEG